jgi:hypothetical protein
MLIDIYIVITSTNSKTVANSTNSIPSTESPSTEIFISQINSLDESDDIGEGIARRWHYKGCNYLKTYKNHVLCQYSLNWYGVYLPDEDRIDISVPEPTYEDVPPPLILMEDMLNTMYNC